MTNFKTTFRKKPATERIGISSIIEGIKDSGIFDFFKLEGYVFKSPTGSPHSIRLFWISIFAPIDWSAVKIPVRAGLSPMFLMSKFPSFAKTPSTSKKAADEISPGTLNSPPFKT